MRLSRWETDSQRRNEQVAMVPMVAMFKQAARINVEAA